MENWNGSLMESFTYSGTKKFMQNERKIIAVAVDFPKRFQKQMQFRFPEMYFYKADEVVAITMNGFVFIHFYDRMKVHTKRMVQLGILEIFDSIIGYILGL